MEHCEGPCFAPPHPDLIDRLNRERSQYQLPEHLAQSGFVLALNNPDLPGLNDGTLRPPSSFPLGTPLKNIRNAALERATLKGAVKVYIVLVDFSDKVMGANVKTRIQRLFFGPTLVGRNNNVDTYYKEASRGKVSIKGEVVGPLRLPQTLAHYADGQAGRGSAEPNSQTLANDTLKVVVSTLNPDFTSYDNDGNGNVDAFIIVHAGSGAEETGNMGDIWSVKWNIPVEQTVGTKRVYTFLTVPEDAEVGVCCHELGHLLFGWPDLYDTDTVDSQVSNGAGNWCLMAGGTWGGNPQGSKPAHPSAWCKLQQGWVTAHNPSTNTTLNVRGVQHSGEVVRLWNKGAAGPEYFLLENRTPDGYDQSLPGHGLLIWHIDDSVPNNRDESHYKVALMQADGKRQLEMLNGAGNRGDAGDSYPGTNNNNGFTATSFPNSNTYNGVDSGVAVTNIPAPAVDMNVNIKVA